VASLEAEGSTTNGQVPFLALVNQLFRVRGGLLSLQADNREAQLVVFAAQGAGTTYKITARGAGARDKPPICQPDDVAAAILSAPRINGIPSWTHLGAMRKTRLEISSGILFSAPGAGWPWPFLRCVELFVKTGNNFTDEILETRGGDTR